MKAAVCERDANGSEQGCRRHAEVRLRVVGNGRHFVSAIARIIARDLSADEDSRAAPLERNGQCGIIDK